MTTVVKVNEKYAKQMNEMLKKTPQKTRKTPIKHICVPVKEEKY